MPITIIYHLPIWIIKPSLLSIKVNIHPLSHPSIHSTHTHLLQSWNIARRSTCMKCYYFVAETERFTLQVASKHLKNIMMWIIWPTADCRTVLQLRSLSAQLMQAHVVFLPTGALANQVVFSLTKPFTEKICLESKRELMILLKKFASLSNRLFNLTEPCWAKSYSTVAPGSLTHHKAENKTEAKSYEHLMSS